MSSKISFPRSMRVSDPTQLARALDENMRYLERLLNATFEMDHTRLSNVTAEQHHVKYTDGEVDTIVATHTALPSAHHAKYLDSEAVTAMGVKGDANPLNHDQGSTGNGGYRETVFFFSTGTFDKADYPWLTHIRVYGVGGGGGGGGSAVTGGGQGSASGGGGGGGFSLVDVAVADLATSETVTVGSAGGGGAIGAAGGGGGDSSFGTDMVAKGATGGGHMAATSALPFGAQGGSGGQRSAGTGDMKIDGETGGNTLVQTAIRSWRNGGGASHFARASNSRFSGSGNSGGDVGGDYGGGGTGGWSSQSNSGAVGGDGGTGIVIVELFNSDSSISDDIAALRAERITSAQVLTTATGTTIIYNSVIQEDDADAHFSINTSTGVITVNTTGWYSISAGVYYEGNATGRRILTIKHNAGDLAGQALDPPGASPFRIAVATSTYITAADTIEVKGFQSSGGDLDVLVSPLTNITIVKI